MNSVMEMKKLPLAAHCCTPLSTHPHLPTPQTHPPTHISMSCHWVIPYSSTIITNMISYNPTSRTYTSTYPPTHTYLCLVIESFHIHPPSPQIFLIIPRSPRRTPPFHLISHRTKIFKTFLEETGLIYSICVWGGWVSEWVCVCVWERERESVCVCVCVVCLWVGADVCFGCARLNVCAWFPEHNSLSPTAIWHLLNRGKYWLCDLNDQIEVIIWTLVDQFVGNVTLA